MGKSKTRVIAGLEDGGFVPSQSLLIIQAHKKAQIMRQAREVEFARRKAERDRLVAGYLAKEKEEAAEALRMKAHEEEQQRRQEKLQRKQEEYDRPLPDFPLRIPQEVRGQFFQYVARVVSDTLWNLEHQQDLTYDNGLDKYGLEYIPIPNMPDTNTNHPSHTRPRKKVPAECLKAALRISTLGMGGLAVRIYIFIDMNHQCFNESDKIWLGAHSYRDGFHFEKRMEYRIKRNLWKNIPYFISFDPERQSTDRITQVIEWDVHRERDLEILKKSGFLYPDEEKVIHLEIF